MAKLRAPLLGIMPSGGGAPGSVVVPFVGLGGVSPVGGVVPIGGVVPVGGVGPIGGVVEGGGPTELL